MDTSTAFPDLCNAASFVTNSRKSICIKSKLTPPKALVLASLLSSVVEIEHLRLIRELPSFSPALSDSVSISVRSFAVGIPNNLGTSMPNLVRTICAALTSRLEIAEFSGVKFSSEDTATLGSALGRCPVLRSLRVFNCDLTANTESIVTGLGQARSLESVSFCSNSLRDEDEEKILLEISGLPFLEDLEMMWFSNSVSYPKALGNVCHLRQLKRLNTSGLEDVKDEGIGAIVSGFLLRPTVALQDLDVSRCEIFHNGGIRLADLVRRAPFLRSLDLSFNHIGSEAAGELGKAIRSSCAAKIEKLNLVQCELGPTGMVGLFNPLSGGSGLTRLEIAGNKPGDEGMAAIALCLGANGGRNVLRLELSESYITSKGAKELAKSLSSAYSLKRIYLSNDSLAPDGGTTLLDTLATPLGCRMRVLTMSGCKIGDAGAEAASNLVMKRGCDYLDLMNNGITARGFARIVDAVVASHESRGKTMLTLKLESNPAGDEGALYVVQRLARMGVAELRIDEVGMADPTANALVEVIRKRGKNDVLEKICVSVERCGKEVIHVLEETASWGRKGGRKFALELSYPNLPLS